MTGGKIVGQGYRLADKRLYHIEHAQSLLDHIEMHVSSMSADRLRNEGSPQIVLRYLPLARSHRALGFCDRAASLRTATRARRCRSRGAHGSRLSAFLDRYSLRQQSRTGTPGRRCHCAAKSTHNLARQSSANAIRMQTTVVAGVPSASIGAAIHSGAGWHTVRLLH